MTTPRRDPEPPTDEEVAAEMWRLDIETPWDRAHPQIQKLMIGQVTSVRRALASLAQQAPSTP